jgi:hypothetical protein
MTTASILKVNFFLLIKSDNIIVLYIDIYYGVVKGWIDLIQQDTPLSLLTYILEMTIGHQYNRKSKKAIFDVFC